MITFILIENSVSRWLEMQVYMQSSNFICIHIWFDFLQKTLHPLFRMNITYKGNILCVIDNKYHHHKNPRVQTTRINRKYYYHMQCILFESQVFNANAIKIFNSCVDASFDIYNWGNLQQQQQPPKKNTTPTQRYVSNQLNCNKWMVYNIYHEIRIT